MKELTLEQKAKRYDEALERAKKLHIEPTGGTERIVCEQIFSELKESEDEKIRKCVKYAIDKLFLKEKIVCDVLKDEVLAWLEKQGKKEVDPRYENLEELIAADDIYQMATNDKMVQNAKEKAVKALSELCIGKLLGVNKQGEQKPFDYENADIVQKDYAPNDYNSIDPHFGTQIEMRPSWSEEDTFKVQRICKYLNEAKKYYADITEVRECIEWLKSLKDRIGFGLICTTKELESSDEQKPTDKVEPKFRVEKDKWYVCTSQYCNCIEGRNYKASLDGIIMDDYDTEYDMHNDAYRWFRPWTIQDAKEGDVLAAHECLVSFKEIDGLNIRCYGTYYMGWNPRFVVDTLQNKDAFHPATKEQRDLFLKKINEAGYEFDFEKKELKIIDWSKHIKYNPNGPSITEEKS